MDRGSGVFIKYGVAARGFYMFFNFVTCDDGVVNPLDLVLIFQLGDGV